MIVDDYENFVVFSGGGAGGIGQWETYKHWLDEGNVGHQFGGTSAGCLNAMFASRGLVKEADGYYAKTYDGTASDVFGPELCNLANGKLVPNLNAIRDTVLKGLNVWDFPKLVTKNGQKKLLAQLASNAMGIQSLLNNKPLLASVKEILELPCADPKPFLFNMVNMVTGGVIRAEASEFPNNDSLATGIIASTNIPCVLPLVPVVSTSSTEYKLIGDGGLRDGSPIGQMLKRLDPDKKQRVVVFNINKREMTPVEDLNNIFKVAARSLEILMNEVLMGDLDVLLERNKTALMYGERPGYKYVEVLFVESSHNRKAFDFTKESYDEQVATAAKDLKNALHLQA